MSACRLVRNANTPTSLGGIHPTGYPRVHPFYVLAQHSLELAVQDGKHIIALVVL